MFSAAELQCEGILVGRAIEAAHRRAVGAGAGSGELRACSRRASTSIRRPCTQIEGRRSKKSPPPPSCRKSNSGQRRRPCPHAAAPDLLPDAMRLRRTCSPMARPRPADRAPAAQRFSIWRQKKKETLIFVRKYSLCPIYLSSFVIVL
jgi:hypothetical protein